MSYQLQFRTCKEKTAAMLPPQGEEFNRFATYSDLLLTGQDMRVDIPGTEPDEHIDQVMLVYKAERPVMVCSVFLLCPCSIDIDRDQRAKSELLVAQKQLVVPKR